MKKWMGMTWLLAALPGALLVSCKPSASGHAAVVPAAAPVTAPVVAASEPVATAPEAEADEYQYHATYSQVEDKLYVGGRTFKPPPGTSAVLSLSYNQDAYKVASHKYSSIPDGPPAPSLAWLKQQVMFVDGQIKADHVTFVHCDAGVSRGPTVVLAYLMYHHHWTRDKALEFLRDKRPIVGPNMYFMDMLSDWEEALAKEARPAAASRP